MPYLKNIGNGMQRRVGARGAARIFGRWLVPTAAAAAETDDEDHDQSNYDQDDRDPAKNNKHDPTGYRHNCNRYFTWILCP